MYDAGFPNIVNIDFSAVVIDSMRQKHEQQRPSMRWEVMDMTDLKYEDGVFDVVIDKAAMDALMCDEGDVWDPNPEVLAAADRMCGHISRVLKPNGLFLQISFAQPHFRRKYLLGREAGTAGPKQPLMSKSYGWNLEHKEISTCALVAAAGVWPMCTHWFFAVLVFHCCLTTAKSEGCICDFLYVCRKQS
jgi:ubiquinone/menaquinone biosynthesis C-methylase UbiE